MPNSKIVAKLVASGIALIFVSIGILSYADTVNSAWNEAWAELAHKPAPFVIINGQYPFIVMGTGFALIGIGYLFHRY